ncbi:DUF4328 domain-containing protein [Rubinisphaera margarita]|uniref:DUF4328 domain-containing protein n=1 Tax=Rubinisphaera margarita TaxID=2909586 RepID=UPI001EE843F9|nr:DUF4328 domain-containing protein [Rubinisphaera margarita]MCG6158000.1 DUF4328 domain-containing protein [Rubinisphaera margarita]
MTLKPLSRLATPLLVLLKLQIVLLVIAVIFDITQVYLFQQASEGVDVVESLESVLFGNGIVALVQVAFFVITGIIFLRWKYRANKNLRELSTQEFEYTPGWAVGAYFVPLANLVMPYRAMKEIWTAAHRQEEEQTRFLGLWWGAWIISGTLGQLSFRINQGADDLESYTYAAAADFASDGFDILLTLIAIVLVSRITTAYQENYADVGGQDCERTDEFADDAPGF